MTLRPRVIAVTEDGTGIYITPIQKKTYEPDPRPVKKPKKGKK